MKVAPFSRENGKSTILLILFIVAVIAAGIIAQQMTTKAAKLPTFDRLVILPKPKAVGAVNFINHNNEKFSEEDFNGKWSILFFGFTNCPDICPSTLHILKQVKEDLVKAGAWDAYQLAMVSVDPERDTPVRLKQYVPFFDPQFIGLTGELDYIISFAKKLGILFFKSKALENGGYDVDHGASIILMNPQGQFAGVLSAPHKRQTLSADLIKLGHYALEHQDIRKGSAKSNADSNNTDNSSDLNSAKNAEPKTSNLGLSFDKAWIRPAPPGAVAMAGYFSVTNNSELDITIEEVESQLFDMAMIHQTTIEEGIASMEHLDGLTITAGETVTLKPLGTHLMLMRPTQDLSVGTTVPMTIELASGETQKISIKVQDNPAG